MNNIVCMDNSETIRKIVKDSVMDLGYEFFEAENGNAGLALLQTLQDVGLIIVDWNMPVMSGRETLREIRSLEQFQDTKILVLIKIENKDQVMEAIDLGANMYILKPFSVNNLQNTIEEIMKSAE